MEDKFKIATHYMLSAPPGQAKEVEAGEPAAVSNVSCAIFYHCTQMSKSCWDHLGSMMSVQSPFIGR